MAHYPELLVQRPHGEPFRFTLDKEIVSIGRSSQNHLALEDHWLSRRHAELRPERGEYFVHDLNSRNGTTVNGVPVLGKLALRTGDVIRLGEHTLTFLQASSGSIVLTEHAGELDVMSTVVVPTEQLLADRSGETQAMRAPPKAIRGIHDIQDSIVQVGIRSAMCVPLWNDETVIGLLYTDCLVGENIFTEDDLSLLASLANLAAIKIENARLIEQMIEKKWLEHELNLAAEIHRSLLPREAPQVAGWDIAGTNEPCYTIGRLLRLRPPAW